MKEVLQKYLQSLNLLENKALEELLSKVLEYEYPVHYQLIRADRIAHKIYFVVKGALRSYYLKDGKEVTVWFAFENEFATSFYSLVSQQASYETIELLEDSTLLGINYSDLNELIRQYPSIGQLHRLILEKNYLEVEQRLMSLQFGTAREKYNNLLAHFPHILQRVPLGYIASFLGITQETLSRIRSNK